MISQIKGPLLGVEDEKIIIDAGGLGYEVEVSSSVLAVLPLIGEELNIFCHFVVREDAQLLYGFSSKNERTLFRTYIRINGVGPKLALALISSLNIESLRQAVDNKDESILTSVPGVGKKTAERLLVELKNQLSDIIKASPETQIQRELGGFKGSVAMEAEDALVALGYKSQEAHAAVAGALNEFSNQNEISLNDLIRLALRGFVRE